MGKETEGLVYEVVTPKGGAGGTLRLRAKQGAGAAPIPSRGETVLVTGTPATTRYVLSREKEGTAETLRLRSADTGKGEGEPIRHTVARADQATGELFLKEETDGGGEDYDDGTPPTP
jgi:hypothetical protein